MNTTKLSRRTALAAMTATLATGAAAAPSSVDDHELLALGAQIDALWPELTAAEEASSAAAHTADEETSRRLGFDIRVRTGKFMTGEPDCKIWAMKKVVWGELRTDDAHRKCGEVWARADRIHQRIIDTPASTVAGFAVKARAAAMLAASNLWDQRVSDHDWDKHVIRNLIEALCAAAGMPLPLDIV